MNLRKLFDILIPRFITEDVAVEVAYCSHCDEAHPQPVCCMADVEPDDVFDGIMTMSCFNLFGLGLFPRQVSEIRPWVNPHDKRTVA